MTGRFVLRSFACLALATLMNFCLPALGAKAPQGDGEQAAVQKVVDEMFLAMTSKNRDAFAACWAPNAPAFARMKTWTEELAGGAEDLRVVNVSLTRWKFEKEKAAARLAFDLLWNDARTKEPHQVKSLWVVQFLKQADGWKWWEQNSASGALFQALMNANNREEAARLMADDRELVTTEEITSLLDGAYKHSQEKKADGAITASKEQELIGFVVPYWNTPQAGKFNESHQAIEIALLAAEFVGDKVFQGWANAYDGHIFKMELRHAEQLAHQQRALQLFQEGKSRRGEAVAHNSIGGAYLASGRYAEALEAFQTALTISREDDQKDIVATALDNLGEANVEMGRYAEALPLYQRALAAQRELKSREDEADVLNDIGILYKLMGRYDEAVAAFEACLNIARDTKKETLEALAVRGLGEIFQLQSNNEAALRAYKSSAVTLALYERRGEQRALMNKSAAIYTAMGKYEYAQILLENCLKDAREAEDKSGEAETLNHQGDLDRAMGKHDDALAHYAEALKIAEPIGDLLNVVRANSGVGDVHRTRKQWAPAAEAYRNAIRRIELLRTQTKEQSLQTSFFNQYTAPYYHLVESLLGIDTPDARAEAFAVSEQAKARTLVELMEAGKVNIFKAMTDAERGQEQQLDARVTALTVQLNEARSHSNLKREERESLQQQLNQSQAAYDDFRRQLFLAHPELQVQRAQFQPVSLVQLNRTVFSKYPRLALLSYLADEEGTSLFALTRGADAQSAAKLSVFRLPVTRKELGERVEALRLACVRGRGHNARGVLVAGDPLDYRDEARALYGALVAPAEKDIENTPQVVILPDGVLHTLPFQVLIDSRGRHWIEKQALSYAPSVTALGKMLELRGPDLSTAPAGKDSTVLLAVGRPDFGGELEDLPATEDEVKAIAGLFHVEPLVGKRATKARARAEMVHARYLHFATHGLINEAAPMYSAIALTREPNDDGLLTARELMDTSLSSDLVVLSACETALGKQTHGEGVLGLTWALFVAGAHSSVVTQWSVEDESTSELMRDFYGRLTAASTGKAEALRQAQLKLMHDGKHAHPYFWAPFVLDGSWE